MDTTNHSVSSSRRKTPTKRCKPDKRDPIKVVYISNPMNFRVTASEFRALVQELTGWDAGSLPDPSRFRNSGGDDSDNVGGGDGRGDQTDNSERKNDRGTTSDDGTLTPRQVEGKDYKWEGQVGSTVDWFEGFDDVDVFASQISTFYESPQADHHQVLHAV
ncbi:hypothetical protein QN277_013377 [Acacia crassicarpa]|uniref:VQ domain-containing protein n=1 Tax=Acacia crassicarpa TaxID=499986 RepID=A0AAE1N376_9FABA|nr:hypothetical protein QN277_013377 [Acacia crassicarpa]